jgi:hypothetical protein
MTDEKNEKQAMSLQVTEGLTVTVLPDSNHEFLMSTKEVAHGYGVHPDTIRSQKRHYNDEFIEGKHFISNVQILHVASSGSSRGTFWTKRGIVRLGFFIKSDRARLFRDWAEDLVINKLESKQKQLSLFQEKSMILEKRYVKYPEFKELWNVIESAIMACGSANQLANRLGIDGSAFSLIKKRPWLVSEEKQKAILIGCRNILSRDAKIDTETIEQLMMIDDHDLRMNLYSKMRKGGLL